MKEPVGGITRASISTVLLDAGGVLLDESEHEVVRAAIISEILREVTPGYSVSAYWADVEEAVQAFCPSVYRYVLWKHCEPNVGLFSTLEELHQEQWRLRKPPLRLLSGVEDEVMTLSHRLKLGIAGQYGREILGLLENHGILDCFANRLTQDDFAITKPDPRYYEQIAHALGVNPGECVMVGDRVDKDVIPARQVGMKTVLVRVGLHRNQRPRIPSEIADAEIPSVQGLADVVLGLAGLT